MGKGPDPEGAIRGYFTQGFINHETRTLVK